MAIECSNPAATNAEIGNTTPINLSTTVLPAKDIQIAKQTRLLHKTPKKNACQNGSPAFAAAIFKYVAPTAPPFSSQCPDKKTRSANPAAPIKLAKQTTAQFRSSSVKRILPSAHAMAIKIFPVKSSDPHTTTNKSPIEKQIPPINLAIAKLSSLSLTMIVKYRAPIPTKPPAIIPNRNNVLRGNLALVTPPALTLAAISAGV